MNVTCVFAKSNQAINNPGMDVAGYIFDLPTCVMSPAGFRCDIMLRSEICKTSCVSLSCSVFYYLACINSSKVFLLVSELDIASVLELALLQAQNCFLFIKNIRLLLNC